jgi:hypothetical protein
VPHKKEYRRQRVRHYGTPNEPKFSAKNAKIPIQNENTNHEKRKSFPSFSYIPDFVLSWLKVFCASLPHSVRG